MRILKNNWLRAGLTLIVLLFGIFVVTKATEGKNPINQQLHYFVWNDTEEEWEEVESEDELPLCPPGGERNCSATSTGIMDGQPAGTVTIRTKP